MLWLFSFYLRDVNIHLVFPAFTSWQLSLQKTNKTAVLFFIVCVLSVTKYKRRHFRYYNCIKSIRQPATLHCKIHLDRKLFITFPFYYILRPRKSVFSGVRKTTNITNVTQCVQWQQLACWILFSFLMKLYALI